MMKMKLPIMDLKPFGIDMNKTHEGAWDLITPTEMIRFSQNIEHKPMVVKRKEGEEDEINNK